MHPYGRWSSFLSSFFGFCVVGLCVFTFANAKVLTPPYFNLALGRRIVATATCGEPEPELFCKLIGADAEVLLHHETLIQGQSCGYCNSSNPEDNHGPEFAVDGRETWWQSPPLSRGISYNEVNLTIDLGQEFHVAYVIVTMANSPRPGVWALERSNDNGQTFLPWQYFANTPGECSQYFGNNVSFTITADDSVICTTEFSKIVPLEGGEIVVPLVQNRPSANDFFNSAVLQEWTRATNVRFRLIKIKNLLGHLMSLANQDTTTTRRYFYSIKDISIGGRCRCNGHADTCTSIDQNDPYRLVCDCKDNTCGNNCEVCCPGFEQKKWSQSKNNRKFVCEPCNCNLHSDRCVYNETVDNLKLSLDIHGNYEGGGVCLNCQDNTDGINCDKCANGYYRPYGKKPSDFDACSKCRCDNPRHTGNCEDGTGRCECKPEYTKPNCDSCSYGHYGFPLCRPCDCNINGTTSLSCTPDNGVCPCRSNFGGPYCRVCAAGYYNYPECKPCECSSIGSASNVCDIGSGDCKCKSNFGGKNCDQCNDGYYSFPSCTYCNCDVKGTLAEVCNKNNGQCSCKPGYGGPRCDQCIASYTGFPDCKPCNCSSVGSYNTVCDASGRCSCQNGFGGKQCDQCSPGYYQYPNCTDCNCHPVGSLGVACNDDGSCICKPNFDGEKCTDCKKGFYNYPNCEECTYNPAGVISTFTGCFDRGPQPMTIQCKPRVKGKQCNDCKEPYWNLQMWNPDGCEECGCSRNGTIGGLASCDTKTGQCFCKPSVTSKLCSQCADGYYNLAGGNLFGCTECDCDVGGAVNNVCDKKTGQCRCHPRVEGRNCKKPLTVHYFPTLHQYQYEIEDGHTPGSNPVRYGFEDYLFPEFSWRGYAIFSHLQNETVHDIMIQTPSVYRIILRYVNPNQMAISGTISVNPELTNNIDAEQKFTVLFKPTTSPSFVTVAGISGNNPSPFVMNPGPWILKIKIEKGLFLDYFVLMPAEYYEGSLLVSNVTNPCTIDKSTVCKQYLYPNVSEFDQVKGAGGYINNGDSRSPIQLYFNDYYDALGWPKIPVITNNQPDLYLDLRVTRPGQYVLVVLYATTKNQNNTVIQLEARTQNKSNKTMVTIYNCRYTVLCRQMALDRDGVVQIFDFDSNFINLVLKGAGDGIGIDSVVAIPVEKWSLGYVQPKPSCLMKDKTCTPATYNSPPDSRRIDFKTGNEEHVTKLMPSTISDNSTELIYLDSKESTLDLKGKVPKPGPYVFAVHYYQPDFPEFDVDVLIHNGVTYEAKIPVKHCPSTAGCRSMVKQANGNSVFELPENFVFTIKGSNQKHIWLHYLLVIPSLQYTEQIITEQPFDQTAMFISQCGHNHFYLNTSEEGFCRDAAFSLTTKYNHGTIPCACDFEGSYSFECAPFGGQCPCRPNVIGRRCDSCRTGYYGFPNCESCNCPSSAYCDATTGACICPPNVWGDKCNKCRPYTYGLDPIIGCADCNCNVYGVKNNNLQCDLQNGACDCKDNVEGRTCDHCVAGNWQFPDCKPCECDLRGTTVEVCNQLSAECFCKSNVQGAACDGCKDGTFNLQPENLDGCTECFCFGKTTRCSSSGLSVSSMSSFEDWKLAAINYTGKSIEVTSLPTNVEKIPGGVEVNLGYVLEGVSYFVAPEPYLGNKLTAYGSSLNYTLYYTASDDGNAIGGADVILYGANMYIMYESVDAPSVASNFPTSLKIVESSFLTVSGEIVKRAELMQVLQNLTALYIKATYSSKPQIAKLQTVALEVATLEYNQYSSVALSVEKCHCPPNYVGLSCEECADGYYRLSTGPFGGWCVQCQCNGHATSCDKTTGVCHNCKHNTKGDHCEKCEVGYYGNATQGAPNDCLICACPLPIASNNFATGCEINDLGDKITCDCLPGYAGDRCERCAPGFYGRPEVTGEVCVPCNCNGNINPSEPGACDHVTGRCIKCLNNTYGDSCEKCAPGYFGDAIDAKNCQPCDCDKCGTHECDHRTGQCSCRDNIVGEKCDRCADNHYGFTTCQGCSPCNCGEASESLQCDDLTGQCRCKNGVTGQTCDKCTSGYWKYSADGCTSCGCNTEYSVGFGCNVNTGTCECLPGVVGDKCNQCPYRWVLIPTEGCFGCDKCIDGLLDVTDALQVEFFPIFDKFQTASIGYFTVQRLKFINETANKLAPNVSDVLSYQFDLTPYIQNISIVESETENFRRMIQLTLNDVLNSAKNGTLIYENALEVEKLINEVMDKSRRTVFEINNLAHSLETGAATQVDSALKQADRIKNDIGNYELDDEWKTEALDALDKANNLTSSVMEFSKPLNKTTMDLETVKLKKESLHHKFDDLEEFSEKARQAAVESIGLNQLQKKTKVSERVDSLWSIKADAENASAELSAIEKNTSALLDKAKENFKRLGDAKQNLSNWESKADQNLTALKQQLSQALDEVRKAREHAMDLERQAFVLQSTAGNQASAEHAVKAANAYADIVNAVEAALANITQAKKDVELAIEKSQGLLEKLQSSQSASLVHRDNARTALEDVQGKLGQESNSAMQQENLLSKNVNQTALDIENIRKKLNELEAQNRIITDELQTLNPDKVSSRSQDTLNSMKDITNNLPKKLEDAKNIYNDRSNKRKTAMEIQNFLDKVENEIPDVKKQLDMVRNKSNEMKLDNSITNISKNLESLKQTISRAKDAAAKIKVGVTFSPKTSLELPVPSNLLDQGSSTDVSLYFNTNQSNANALLFYLGNEGTTSRQKRDVTRKSKTDDYLALMLVNGYPIVKIDLGERKVATSYVDVNGGIRPNEWYNARIERTGKLVNITITNSKGKKYESKGECPGLYSVLNLDRDHSKFFIGGLPPAFEAPSAIEYTTFSGQIQDVTVNDVPIGLWNFVNISKPVPGAINGSVERDVLLENTTPTACRFAGDGYVKLPASSYMTSEMTQVVMNFKTTSDDGLLFLTYKDQTFISIELRSGYIYFQYNVGKGLKALTSGSNQCNDGEWHTVDISRFKNTGSLKIDGKELQREDSSKDEVNFEVPQYIFIGGYEGDHKLPDVMKKPFEGCVDNVLIKGEAVDVGNNPNAYRTIPGCTDQLLNFISFEEGSHGYVLWTHPNRQSRWNTHYNIELSLRIKTKASSALIAYGSDGTNTFYLQLSDGAILFKSGSQKVDTGPNVKYNDSRWHAITAVHEPNALYLVVDDFEVFKSSQPPTGNRFDISGSIFFGTVLANIDATAALESPFAGCIGDVTFNGVLINFEEVSEGMAAVIGKCSGRGKDIKSKPNGLVKPSVTADSSGTTPTMPEPTTMPPVTVAPGSLPLYPAPDPDVTQESGQRFGTTKDSALLYDFNPDQFGGEFALSMDIRTIASDGIIFYVTQQQRKDFVALYLKDSNLNLRYRCGDHSDTLSTPMVNQAEWHTVKFTVAANNAEMTINGNSRKSSSVGCSPINLSPPYFVGGFSDQVILESAKLNLEGLNKTFVGCLRNFKPNGKVAEKPKPVGVIPCSSKVEEGTFFPPGEAYIKTYERFNVGKEVEIRMQIKPRNISGVLAAVHSKKDFLVLQMVNGGSIDFTVENGNGPVSATFTSNDPFYFLDGEWHTITAQKVKNVIVLTVDENSNPPQMDNGYSVTVDTNHPLYIGGYPFTLAKSKGIKGHPQYVGCIRNVEIRGRKEQLSSFTPYGNVMFNVCPTI